MEMIWILLSILAVAIVVILIVRKNKAKKEVTARKGGGRIKPPVPKQGNDDTFNDEGGVTI